MSDSDMSSISGDALRIDDAPKVFADVDDPADVASDANATGDVMANDPFAGLQADLSMNFGGVPDDQDSVRTVHGHTDFLGDLHQDKNHRRGSFALPPDIAAGLPKRRRRVDANIYSKAPDKMRTATFTLGIAPNGQRIAVDREGRRRLVITNYDTTGPVFVSESNGVTAGSPDAVRIPAAPSATTSSSRDFYTQQEVWVAGNTGAMIDVLDEYDEDV